MRPYSLSKRGRIYYVQFRNPLTHKFETARSTGKTDLYEAHGVAADWLKNGFPIEKGDRKPPGVVFEAGSIIDSIKKGSISGDDAEKIASLLKEKGLLAESKRKTPLFITFLYDAWNEDTSPFLAERRAYGYKIGRRHILDSISRIKQYFDCPEWRGVYLSDVKKQDLKAFLLKLSDTGLARATVNRALSAVSTPLAWAYQSGIIQENPAEGIPRFSSSGAKRRGLLDKKEIQSLIALHWHDERAKLAFLVALTTGARLGEINALQLKDVGKDRLFVRHSWGTADGLKTPKNGEERQVPLLPHVRDLLLKQGEMNPYTGGEDAFIFWGSLPNQPLDARVLSNAFYKALHDVGINEKERQERGIVFHSLRHQFSTALADRLSERAAMRITGHKTAGMLAHYADHETEDALQQAIEATVEAFENVVTFKQREA